MPGAGAAKTGSRRASCAGIDAGAIGSTIGSSRGCAERRRRAVRATASAARRLGLPLARHVVGDPRRRRRLGVERQLAVGVEGAAGLQGRLQVRVAQAQRSQADQVAMRPVDRRRRVVHVEQLLDELLRLGMALAVQPEPGASSSSGR